MEIIYILIAILIGIAFGWTIKLLIDKNKSGRLEERNNLLKEENNKLDNELNSEREKVLKLNSEISSLKADYENLQEVSNQISTIENLLRVFKKRKDNILQALINTWG